MIGSSEGAPARRIGVTVAVIGVLMGLDRPKRKTATV
jgi:hypothetical protein